MKKRDAIEIVRKALANRPLSDAEKRSLQEHSYARIRPPEFAFSGWHFVALSGPFDDEPLNDHGDAALRAPDGTHVGLAWTATGKLAHSFDFKSLLKPMLHVDIPAPVASWTELTAHLETLAPALDADLRAWHERK